MKKNTTKKITNYLSLVKFTHTIFAMPFALIGFAIAAAEKASFEWNLLIFIVLCMIFARNAAMGFNRYLDRQIDKKNPRTASREIPAGKMSAASALRFVLINAALFVFTTYFINENKLSFYLSPVALLVVLGYSYTKRFTALCHFVLGLGLALAPIGAYLSVTGKFAVLPILFSFVVFFWVSGFDIIYALQDVDFDKSENLKSVPVYLGKKNALLLSSVLHAVTVVLVFWAGSYSAFSWLYWLGASLFSGLLVYQHKIVSINDLSRVNLAFFTTNGVGSVLFAGFTIVSLFVV